MIVVRLARGGARRHPFYHIVVTDSRRRRDSGHIERLGYFNPFATKAEVPVLLNRDRFDYWISKGAKSSQRVSSIVSKLDKGKFTIETKISEVSDTVETPKTTETENVPPAEAKNPDTKMATVTEAEKPSVEEKEKSQVKSPQVELELVDKQKEKQATPSEIEAESQDNDETHSGEPPVESSEPPMIDKKADDK